MTKAKPLPWFRPRFTLAALLLLVTLCAPILAYVRSIRVANERKAAAYEEAVAKGVRFASESRKAAPPATASEKEKNAAIALWKSIVNEPNLPELTRLNIHDLFGKNRPRPPITDQDLEGLQYLTEIEQVDFYYSRDVTDKGLAVLGKLPKLKRLMLNDLSLVTGEFLESFSEDNAIEFLWLIDLKGMDGSKLKGLRKFKNLRQLNLSSCPGMTDDAMRGIDLPPCVTEIQLSRVNIGDETLQRWLGQSKLQRLSIEAPISRAIVPALAKQTGLEVLGITNAPLVDEDFAFLKTCESLSGLTLSGMPIRGQALDFVAKPEEVSQLGLNSTLFVDEHLPKLLKFKKLAILDLRWTPLTGEGFSADMASPKLWNIGLAGTRFSDQGKAAFAKLKNLKMVDLPSNWTIEDMNLFSSETKPTNPSINGFLTIGINERPPYGGYYPGLNMSRIDNAPADLMKPVAELHEKAIQEDREFRKATESPQ